MKRTGEEIIKSIKAICEKYEEQFPTDDGFTDGEHVKLLERTLSRRRTDWLDKEIDALGLSEEELQAWGEYHSEENKRKAMDLFNNLIKMKDFKRAEYVINNMRQVWSLEVRKELVKQIGEAYDISPVNGCVATKKEIKNQLKEEYRKSGVQTPE